MKNAPRLPRDNPLHKLYWRVPPHWRHRGVFAETWRFITKSQRWSRDRMDAYVQERLVHMVRHAARTTPFYRLRFRELGMNPEDFHGSADLARLPLTSREDLRDHMEEIVPEGQDRSVLEYASTGGSSGIPVGYYRHRERTYPMELAFMTRFRGWAGLSDTSREVVLAGGVKGADGKRSLWALDRRRNSLALSSDDLTREHLGWMLSLLRQFKPVVFRGYASALAAFAGMLLDAGEKLRAQAVFSASETLYEAQRRRIEEAFGTRVWDGYGHSERVIYAGQCDRHEGYHIFGEYGFIELVDEGGNPVREEGVVGEVVGTTFLHDYFPLVRYRTGDRAVYTAKSCDCSLPYPIILRPDGRLQELLVAEDGRRISMTSINRHDDLFVTVDQFQFHQTEPGRAVLKVVPKPGFDASEEARILAALHGHIGAGVTLKLERVDRIEKTRIGKHRFLIQEIDGV